MNNELRHSGESFQKNPPQINPPLLQCLSSEQNSNLNGINWEALKSLFFLPVPGPSFQDGRDKNESASKNQPSSRKENSFSRPALNYKSDNDRNNRGNVRDRLGRYPSHRNNRHQRGNHDGPDSKRLNDGGGGPVKERRDDRFHGYNNRRDAYGHSFNNYTPCQTKCSVQHRLNVFRNENQQNATPNENPYPSPLIAKYTDVIEDAKEDVEMDALDLTVEVMNDANANVIAPQENITRFALILDAEVQSSIKKIQSRRKEPQLVFPYLVTPHYTGMSMHHRFSVLQ